MNILFLNSAGIWGGNEKWTHMAATSLSKKHRVFLAYKHAVISERYHRIAKLQLPFRFSLDPVSISKLISFIKENNIDVLIPTKKRDYVIAGLCARYCGIKNILRLGIVRKLGRNPYKKFVYSGLADAIIVNAEKIKTVLLESSYMKPEEIHVIYNGLDTEILDVRSQEDPSVIKKYPFMITTIGRISRRKGLDTILRIFAEFLRNIQPEKAGITIIGSGKRMDEYKKLVSELGISDFVQFTGYLNNPYPHLLASDVYLTLSKNEGISNALLEAMYLENAVISTRAGGTGEVITDGENGILLDGNIVTNCVTKLTHLFADRNKRESIGNNAKQTVIKKFTIERMASKIEDVIYEATG